MRKVTRTYKTKNGMVTKVYQYKNRKHKSTRSKTLVGKNGKVNKKNVDEFIEKINSSDVLNAADKRSMINDLKAYVKQRASEKKKLTISGFQGHLESDKMDRMFANLGSTSDELADEYGFDVKNLENAKNWKDGIYIDPSSGKRYRINWDYSGSVFEEII